MVELYCLHCNYGCYEAIVRCEDGRARPNRARPWHAHGMSVTIVIFKLILFDLYEIRSLSKFCESRYKVETPVKDSAKRNNIYVYISNPAKKIN